MPNSAEGFLASVKSQLGGGGAGGGSVKTLQRISIFCLLFSLQSPKLYDWFALLGSHL